MCDEVPHCVTEAAYQNWLDEVYARAAAVLRRAGIDPDDISGRRAAARVAGLDPDGPLQPMRPVGRSVYYERKAQEERDDRDAALISAIAKLWG
jgi:hypothetical protein